MQEKFKTNDTKCSLTKAVSRQPFVTDVNLRIHSYKGRENPYLHTTSSSESWKWAKKNINFLKIKSFEKRIFKISEN